jgi:hypothetical protein
MQKDLKYFRAEDNVQNVSLLVSFINVTAGGTVNLHVSQGLNDD